MNKHNYFRNAYKITLNNMQNVGIIKVGFSSVMNRIGISSITLIRLISLKKTVIFGISTKISINGQIFNKKYCMPYKKKIQISF